MPRNDNPNPGPWGAPPPGGGSGGGPKGPRGPGQTPDLESLLLRLNQRTREFFTAPDGRGLRPGAVAAVAAVVFALWTLSGVYVVQPDEQAVVTTFGAYARSEDPGLRYHLPTPIEAVEKVSVTSLNRLDVGGSAGAPIPDESLMLTGDENIVDLDFSVQWRVSDASRYLFNLRDQDAAVKDVAESAMREVVGATPLQAILTNGRGQVQDRAQDLMQKMLDAYGAGITVVAVQIRMANPPAEVVPAFQQVASAGQEAESAINEANTYKNRVVNEAIGDAARITQSAQAYREQAVREAEGEAARFNQIYEQYRRAPAVTRQRLYLETMERVLAKSNKVIVDGKGTSAPIILPPDVFKSRAAEPAASAAAPLNPASSSGPPQQPGAPAPTQGAVR